MKWYQRFIARRKRLALLGMHEQMIYGYMCEPSTREIGRALNLPKSTVHDSVKRLRKAGLGRGRWSF